MSETQAPGFFGKIPARGDFLSRRVPPAIAAAWEVFLQEMTAGVRAAGVSGWQDAWLTAPLWHFSLGSQLAPPHGAAGVLVASADRVGRLFPFTLIGAAAYHHHGDRRDWALQAEALVMGALDEACDPAELDASLSTLGPPPALAGADQPTGLWPVELEGDWPTSPSNDWQQVGPGQSQWWCRGSDRIAPVRLRCHGLPGPRRSTAMILGGEDVSPIEDYA